MICVFRTIDYGVGKYRRWCWQVLSLLCYLTDWGLFLVLRRRGYGKQKELHLGDAALLRGKKDVGNY